MTTSAILTEIGLVVTQTIAWSGDVMEFIVANPLLLIPAAISIFGGSIILIRSFMR